MLSSLLCPEDNFEIDDTYDVARHVSIVDASYNHLFDVEADEDWMKFDANLGRQYDVQTMNLSSGVDTYIELYDIDGVTLLASDNDSGERLASNLTWEHLQVAHITSEYLKVQDVLMVVQLLMILVERVKT